MTNTTPVRGGPHPGVLAIVTLGLTVIGLIVGSTLSGGATAGSPFVPIDELRARYTDHAIAVTASSFFVFGAAVPLGILAAVFTTRLHNLGVTRVPGPSIGYFGGMLAAIGLALSGLLSWTAAQPDVAASGPLVRALAVLSFLVGGPAYAVGVGLLIAGVAVPGVILRLMPRWLAWVGLVIAGLSELSALSLLLDPFQYLIPVARFAGGAWFIVAGFLLVRTRAARNADVARDTDPA